MGSAAIENPKVRHQLAVTIRTLLQKNQWSEAELGRRSGVSQKHINNIVREKDGCTVECLAALAKTFNIPAWQLLVWGRAASNADPFRLEKLAVGYLNSDEATRSVMDRIVADAKK